MAREHGFVYYEGDAAVAMINPLPDLPEEPDAVTVFLSDDMAAQDVVEEVCIISA